MTGRRSKNGVGGRYHQGEGGLEALPDLFQAVSCRHGVNNLSLQGAIEVGAQVLPHAVLVGGSPKHVQALGEQPILHSLQPEV